MALLKAFRKQLERRPCPVCGYLVTQGLYRSHLNDCKLQPEDEDCQIIAEVSAGSRKRAAVKVSLDDSDDLFDNPEDEQLARESNCRNKDFKDILPDADSDEETSVDTDQQKQMAEIVMQHGIPADTIYKTSSTFTRKRPKKIRLSNSRVMEVSQKVDSQLLLMVGKRSGNSQTSKEITSVDLKHCSENKEMLDYQNEKKSFDEGNLRNVFHCEATTSRDIKTEPKENLSDILESIKSYLNICNCDIIKNSQIQLGHEDPAVEDRHVGSPYHLTLFHKILRRVFCSEGRYGEAEFWGEHLHWLKKFVVLSDESKQLLIRLFLRKRKWLIADKLSYTSIPSSLKPLFEELFQAEIVESSHSSLLEISEAVHLLHASSLKAVAKQFKLDFNKGKIEICRSLLSFATQKNVFGITMEKRVLQKVKEELGSCFRLRREIINFFSAVFTIYSPIDMSSSLLFKQPSTNLPSQLLFVLLQLGTDKLRFPAPHSPSLINIYTDAEKLFRYVEAKELETEIADLTQRGAWAEITNCAKKARIKFQSAYGTQRQFYEYLPSHLRRFTDLHVYASCISHGVEALERIRDYTEAVTWLEYMLRAEEFKLIFANARGGWWDRLALNLDAHLKDKNRAMQAIVAGLEDPILGEKDRLSLQDRGRKLCSKWKGPLEELKPERINIKGLVVGKNLGESRINRFLVERNGLSCECSVEQIALDHYLRKKGFREGIHAEGELWHTIFGLLFYDIIFDPTVKNVWFSETQMNPADLNSRTFYTDRRDLFELRFKEVEEADFNDLLLGMEKTYRNYYGVTNSEISWNCFSDFEQVKRFMTSCPITALCATIRRLITDYRNCRSGFPDLTIWNDQKKLLAVVEVKGPGDKLSTKQRLWLNFFQNQNIIAHVCHVSAQNPRKLD